MDSLSTIDSLSIREKKHYTSIPSAWDVRPEFCLTDSTDGERFYLFSEKGQPQGFLNLQQAKTTVLYMVNLKGEEIFYFEKKTGVLGIKMEVFDAQENLLGIVQKSLKSIRNTYEIHDPANRLLFQIEGPAMMPENFTVLKQDVPSGKMSKKMSKQLEEGAYKQDHFSIVFPMGSDIRDKGVLLGALILIDLFH